MPSNPIDEFLQGLDPIDAATLFAGLRNSVPIGLAFRSGELNAGEDEELAKRRPPAQAPAPRPRTYEDEQRSFEAQFPDPKIRSAVLAELIAQRTQPYHPATATRRADFAQAPEGARQSMRAAPKKFQAGGIAKAMAKSPRTSTAKAREIAGGDLFHGGDIKRGDVIRRPLFMTPSLEMAQSYADYKDFGRTVQKFNPPIKKPAPERLVNAAARRYVPENAESGYTPASVFDENLHDPEQIAAMIRELERRGYDAAVATDIGMGGPGVVEAPAVIRFPGQRAFNKGGGVKKTLDEMQAELFKKGAKAADKPDLARRSFFGLGPQSSFPLANLDTKALEKMQQELKGAPSITEKSVTVDPGKGAAKSTLKSLSETPMSRREVLQSAAGQVMRGVLPDLGGLSSLGNVAKAVESVAPAAASPLTNPYAIIMSLMKQGKSEEEIMKMFSKKMPEYNEYAVENMIGNVRNPSGYLYGELPTLKTPSGALREIVEFKADGWDDHLNPLKLKPELRQLRLADPEAYKGIINAAKDISMVSADEAATLGLKQKWIDKFMKGEINYDQLPQYYQRKIDNINAGFGGD